jgi:hypothetical protein
MVRLHGVLCISWSAAPPMLNCIGTPMACQCCLPLSKPLTVWHALVKCCTWSMGLPRRNSWSAASALLGGMGNPWLASATSKSAMRSDALSSWVFMSCSSPRSCSVSALACLMVSLRRFTCVWNALRMRWRWHQSTSLGKSPRRWRGGDMCAVAAAILLCKALRGFVLLLPMLGSVLKCAQTQVNAKWPQKHGVCRDRPNQSGGGGAPQSVRPAAVRQVRHARLWMPSYCTRYVSAAR